MGRMPIRGAGGSSSSSQQRAPYDAPDTLHSIAMFKILDFLSEGEIVGFADDENPLSCVFLAGTPVANADGSLNFQNVQIESRVGTQTQDPPAGFDAVESENLVGVELTYENPWEQTLTNISLSAVRIRLAVPAFLQISQTTGDRTGYRVDYDIRIATDGGAFEIVYEGSLSGKASDTYERTHTIDLPPATTGWTIRVVRLTPNSDSEYIEDTTNIAAYTEIVYGKYRMPNSAWASLIADAKQFSNVPDRAYRIKGLIIKVPSNYDPDTRAYDGVWDGTFQLRYSTNPAWVYYDILTNTKHGLGKLVPESRVDKWALYKIAQYCDELVPDGFGGMEPRFETHLCLQVREHAPKVLSDFATMFRGIAYAAANTIVAVADMPDDPVYPYNQTNVIDGKFTYSGSRGKVRHTVALVSWNNMDNMCKAEVEYVEDKDGIARYGIQPIEIMAVGCRSRGQAHRLGKYTLTTERYETDAVVFNVGLDGTIPAPGKIIKIADPLRAGRRTGGRIKSATINSITVDSVPVIAPGDTVTVVLPTALPQERTVLSVVGNVITFTTNMSAIPLAHSVWLTESSELVAQLFRVLRVKENDDGLTYEISAIEHEPGKYDFVENNLKIEPRPITSNLLLGPPATVTVSDFERVNSNLPVLVMGVDWPKVEGATQYEVSWKRSDNNWTPPVRVPTNRYELEGAIPGMYTVRVSSVNSTGYTSTPRLSELTAVETANFTIVVDVQSVAGILTLDCSKAEQFRLSLIENITEVRFMNVSVETTLIIEVQQTGDFTIAWPPYVVPVSGQPYVVTTGGTPLNPKIDTVGLHTDNKGVTWQLRVDIDDNPAAGGTGGSLIVTISPNPAYGYASVNPVCAVDTTVTGGTLPLTYEWTRVPGGTGDWNGSTGNVGGTDAFACSDSAGPDPVFSRTGTADGYVAQNWQLKVTDSAPTPLVAQTILEIALEDDGLFVGGGGGWTCPWVEAFMADGRRAGDVRVGDWITGVNPDTMEIVRYRVSYSKTEMADCVTLVFDSGVHLTCSTSALIPTPGNILKRAAEMLGEETITSIYGVVCIDKVIEVRKAGQLPVQHITAENGSFLVGDIAGLLAAHHNMKNIPDDDPYRDAWTGV